MNVKRATWGLMDLGLNFVQTVGAMGILTGKTLVSAITPPYSYGREFLAHFLFCIKVCWFPMMVASLGFIYGPAGVQAANFLNLFGAIDRLGGLFSLIVVREFAPFICAIVMAGVAGTAMCADLGARRIREELDALEVLGVDPIKNLVVPRFLSLIIVTALFNVYAVLVGTAGGVLVTVTAGSPLGPFWSTYFSNATPLEFGASLLKTGIFGGIVAIVCCYKGLNAKGGPEGVGRAVNQAVVISFMGIGTFNYIFVQTLLALNPDLSVVK
ncbi:MAG: phospholipid/cholesterol/gamma-HCH transport system permease protein [Thermoleophilaceae bacterium]|jgi:phospholipid/cholesterol/gamma-HCH transport system permease protein|nr:phospholipid/cholesterol/gamma-HCH transport system permease protein [Thermoleophilaceae bacterium]